MTDAIATATLTPGTKVRIIADNKSEDIEDAVTDPNIPLDLAYLDDPVGMEGEISEEVWENKFYGTLSNFVPVNISLGRRWVKPGNVEIIESFS